MKNAAKVEHHISSKWLLATASCRFSLGSLKNSSLSPPGLSSMLWQSHPPTRTNQPGQPFTSDSPDFSKPLDRKFLRPRCSAKSFSFNSCSWPQLPVSPVCSYTETSLQVESFNIISDLKKRPTVLSMHLFPLRLVLHTCFRQFSPPVISQHPAPHSPFVARWGAATLPAPPVQPPFGLPSRRWPNGGWSQLMFDGFFLSWSWFWLLDFGLTNHIKKSKHSVLGHADPNQGKPQKGSDL